MFSVDGDPHFIIQIPEKDDAICFNIDEDPGTVLRLIQDPVTGGGHGLGPGALPETAWSPRVETWARLTLPQMHPSLKVDSIL